MNRQQPDPAPPFETTDAPASFHPPLQKRSRETLHRILTAAEELLRERALEEITLQEVLARSKVSVGAFYARFSSREALVPALYARYDERLTEGAARILAEGRWRGRSLAARVTLLFRYSAMLYRRNHGLMRALALHARLYPAAVSAEQRARRTRLYETIAERLLECRAEMSHPDSDRAVRFALLVAGSTLREAILFDESPHAQAAARGSDTEGTGGTRRMSDIAIARELSRTFLCYVRCEGED